MYMCTWQVFDLKPWVVNGTSFVGIVGRIDHIIGIQIWPQGLAYDSLIVDICKANFLECLEGILYSSISLLAKMKDITFCSQKVGRILCQRTHNEYME
jgi:hypothetical protein